MPSLEARMEYFKAIYVRYHKATKEIKSRILEEFCKVNTYNRKYAIRLLNGPAPGEKEPKTRKKRSFSYSIGALQIAEAIWKASGYLCGRRLKETIPLWLPAARQRFHFSSQIEQELLSIGSRQLDNRLRAAKRRIKKRIYSTTRPGSLLKSMIPIRTSNWDIKKPGFLEIDLVAHCGNSNAGAFIYTLDSTDIQTGWVERVAVLGKGQTGILDGILDIKNALPFRLRGIDSDNGEEFINWHLLRFCLKSRPRIEFTRGRAYKKNDNAYIEQKNWTHVRQIFGWDRYDTEEVLRLINDLYENELRLFQNFFQPSMKLKEKIRVGSRFVRKYDTPQTPFQRVLASGIYHRAKMKKLKEMRNSLDPFELSKTIDHTLEKIFRLASERIRTENPEKIASRNARGCDGTNENGAGHVGIPPVRGWRQGDFHFSRKTRRWRKIMNRLEREAALKK